jgi:tetratricopeptide (TPR) repeat protein
MRYDEAVASFEHSISIQPKNAPALNEKGVALFYMGNYTLALEAFDQAVKTDHGFVKSWNNGAFVFVKQEQYEKAVNAYQNALYYARKQTDPERIGDFQFEMVF